MSRGGERFATGEQFQQFIEASGLCPDDQRFGGVDGAATTQGEDAVTVTVLGPESFVYIAQPGHVRVWLHSVDHADQTLAKQAAHALH
ncbi:hypothetical protein D3C76_1166480 [compost metagenome]